jgi:hypothetical protein
MSHFARVENGLVTQVIVAEQDFINTGAVGDPTQWIQTSYNTFAGAHQLGGTPLRKNYAGIGYTYDSELDAFIPPKPFPSWMLDTETGHWHAPVAIPAPKEGVTYMWNEDAQIWEEKILTITVQDPPQ